MPKLYIMKGLPASGKTTYCRENLRVVRRINRDSIRRMFGYRFPQGEDDVSTVENRLFHEWTQKGLDVVVDNTNLNPKTFNFLKNDALPKDLNYEVEVIDLTHVPPWQCVENDRKRPQHEQVGADVIWNKYYRYLAPEPYKGREGEPFVIISDLDGTVRDNSWRDAYDTTGKCIDDPPRWHVIHAIRGIQDDYTNIMFFSGMEGTEENYDATDKWLRRYFNERFSLKMREPGNSQRDSVVKKDMFQRWVQSPGFQVSAVFDDRPQVIRECWVPLGLYDRIFCVGRPFEEF